MEINHKLMKKVSMYSEDQQKQIFQVCDELFEARVMPIVEETVRQYNLSAQTYSVKKIRDGVAQLQISIKSKTQEKQIITQFRELTQTLVNQCLRDAMEQF